MDSGDWKREDNEQVRRFEGLAMGGGRGEVEVKFERKRKIPKEC